ncbi:MAG: M48 family metallopeptidase [bacterium]|nr:M48 family metallopeptidase [bacterium]
MRMPYGRRRAGGGGGRLLIGIIIAVISIVSYLASQETNPVTGERQYVSLTPQQEIALGLQSAPELIQQFGGEYRDADVQDEIDDIGARLVREINQDVPWQFEFTVLDDPETVNAFALPGGPVFITTALLFELDTEDQVAGVLAHEIVHVLARHSAQRIAQSELTNGLIGAVGVASGDASAAQTAAVIGQLVNMQYGRDDELQSDTLGVCLMIDAGYDPEAMVEVMRVLEAAGGGGGQPEFFSTHPNPQNRIRQIEEAIANSESCRV